jgi:hypothetical protein
LTPDQEDQIRAALGGSSSQSMAPMTMTPAPAMQSQTSAPAAAMSNSGSPAAAMPTAADSREAALAELLMLYKSDRITPAEYQARRAKIMSGN